MQEIGIKFKDGREYVLNNNSDKYTRATIEAGKDASTYEILAFYDKIGGLIKNNKGNKIENGSFWNEYSRIKEEQPKFIKIVEDRIKTLEEGEIATTGLILKNIDHKRAFLGTLMTIAAGILAGLFFLLTKEGFDTYCLDLLARIGGLGFAFFIIFSSIYLILILSQESISLDKHSKFVKDSKKSFIEIIGTTVTDINSYEKYRDQQYKEEAILKKEMKAAQEIWFIVVCSIFVLSSIPILILFWLSARL